MNERKLNKTEIRIRDQVDAIISSLNSDEIAKMVFAYEPIWAIGTGETASPAQAQEIHCLIRSEIAQVSADVAELIPILYGGSVKSTNAEALFSMPDIDGGLVGGASLDAKEFNSICACA